MATARDDGLSAPALVKTMNVIPPTWKLYGVTKNDEKTWLGDFESEKEITGIANFFANNPHFEHMEIYEGNDFRYAVMRIIGGRCE